MTVDVNKKLFTEIFENCPMEMARIDNKNNLTEMSDFLKIYCVWDECSLLFFHVADLAIFRRSLIGSN